MRRIATTLTLLALAALPAASDAETHHCPPTSFDRIEGHAIVAEGIDCHIANGLIHHVISQPISKLVGWDCQGGGTRFSQRWSCKGDAVHLHPTVTVSFALKPLPKSTVRP